MNLFKRMFTVRQDEGGFTYGLRCWVRDEMPNGKMRIGITEPMTLKPVDELETHYIPPTFSMDRDEAQGLMDSLWEAGLRPTEGTGSAGALAATQRHLDDMRQMAFKATGIALPPLKS